jgi:HK97 family phage prohead protease
MTVNLSNPERRTITTDVELRAFNGMQVIVGHAAVFNRLSQNLGGFVERVRPGAFTKTLKEADVRALINHDPNKVLGRNTSGTLELEQDDIGLLYRIQPPNTSFANDLRVSMERKDVRESSFGFFAIDEDWDLSEQGVPIREIIEARLVDVSVVTYPAYIDADSGLRSQALAGLEKRSGVELGEMLADPEKIKCAVGICRADTNGPGATHPEGDQSAKQIEAEQRLAELNALYENLSNA